MDIVALTNLLSPYLPVLMKLGEKAAESASGKIGTDTWETVKKIWEKLLPKLEVKDNARIAAEKVAENTDSQDGKEFFQNELSTLLKENPELSEAIAKIMATSTSEVTSGTEINQNVTGNQNQIIGNMTGGKAIGNVRM